MGVEGLFFAVEAFIVAIAVALAAFIADSLAIKSWRRWPSLQTRWASIMMITSPWSPSSQTHCESNHAGIPLVAFITDSLVAFAADSLDSKSWWCQFASHGVRTMEPPSLPLWKTHLTWFQHHFHRYLHPILTCHYIVIIIVIIIADSQSS